MINPFHNITFFTSFGFLFLSIIAYYYDFYEFAILDFCLFLTSINYWKFPIKGTWQRTLDISVVILVILAHIPWTPWTDTIILLSIIIVGLYGYNKLLSNDHLYNIIRHGFVHILAVVYYVLIYENLISIQSNLF